MSLFSNFTPGRRLLGTARFLVVLAVAANARSESPSGTIVAVPPNPWAAELARPAPQVEWGARTGDLQELTYEGPPLRGKPTKVFALLGRPEGVEGKKAACPAVVLVHGGGGKVFPDWVRHWTKRGYAALAMDTAGQGPDGKHREDGGPPQADGEKFRKFTAAEIPDMWTFHAVSAVLRGTSVLLAQPEVDPGRLALTGISWGGYLTCLVSGLDPRFKASVPVYGCGFLGDDSYWKPKDLQAYSEAERRLWLQTFDPSRQLKNVQFPMLFLNGTNDFAYPMGSHRKTCELVPPAQRTISLQINLKHGHYWEFPEVDAFIDAAVAGGAPLTRLGDIFVRQGSAVTRAEAGSEQPVAKAELHFTRDTGAWQQRKWETVVAAFDPATREIRASLPEARPLAFFLSAVDGRGLRTSTTHAELTEPADAPETCVPAPKLERDFYDWHRRHAEALWHRDLLNPDLVFLGDSITHLWSGLPAEPNRATGANSWQNLTAGRSALNLGFGWDRTQNLLWRLDHGEMDGLSPRNIVVNIGTNNLTGTANAKTATPAEIAEGVRRVLARIATLAPGSKIVLMGIFPRKASPTDPLRSSISECNQALAKLAAEFKNVTFLDLGSQMLEKDGTLTKDMMADGVHPTAKGYEIWAAGLAPLISIGGGK